jgi:hypothetical protein
MTVKVAEALIGMLRHHARQIHAGHLQVKPGGHFGQCSWLRFSVVWSFISYLQVFFLVSDIELEKLIGSAMEWNDRDYLILFFDGLSTTHMHCCLLY